MSAATPAGHGQGAWTQGENPRRYRARYSVTISIGLNSVTPFIT